MLFDADAVSGASPSAVHRNASMPFIENPMS
jgi:hypothetical protein